MNAQQFTIRRKVFTLVGAKFHVYNSEGKLIGFSKQKAFKLKEDIRFYSDETMQNERVRITARSIIDFSVAFDVIEADTGEKVGALRRRGMKSMIRDEWQVLDAQDIQIGTITEDSTAMALLRRFVANLIPQTFHLRSSDGQVWADFRTHFNPFVHKMTVRIYPECTLPPSLVLAAAVLLVAVEGRQQ
jgi:hypothetical protein